MPRKLLLTILFLLVSVPVFGAEVTLQWDANDPIPDGYRIFQRLEDEEYNYTAPAWDGTDTTCVIQNLEPGNTYFFVVRAYQNGDESGDSNEVNFTGLVPIPGNLRIAIEVSVTIDLNGAPTVAVIK